MKLLKATASYKAEMEKHFPNHWPIRAFDFWVDFYNTYGTAPTYEAWEQFDSEKAGNPVSKTALCVNETGNTPAKQDSMQAADDDCIDYSDCFLTDEEMERFETALCVNKAGDILAKQDSMQAAQDLAAEVKMALQRINRATKCDATRFISSEGLQAAKKLQSLLHGLEGEA